MKTYQYLTKDILQSYLLDLASDSEQEEVERLLATDPDVLADLNEVEAEMEQHFLRQAVPPPPRVKEAVLQRINETEIKKWEPAEQSHSTHESARSGPKKPDYIDVEVDDTHIRVHKNWRTAFIAIFILSKIFLILGLYYYFKANSQEAEIERLKAAVPQGAPAVRNPAP